jgi:cytochrome c peroxidase
VKRLALFAVLVACGGKKGDKPPPATKDALAVAADAFVLPPAPPLPEIPRGLPKRDVDPSITPEAVALGELLFWDTRLSLTNTLACSSCHVAAQGFAGEKQQQNSAGKLNLRRAPALVNLAWEKSLGWDGRYASLRDLLAAHLRGQLGDDLAAAVTRITDVPGYRAYFTRMGGPPSADAAMTALSAYVLTRYAGDAPWDRVEGTPNVPRDLKSGYTLFTGKAQCSVCHTPPLYTDHAYHRLGVIKTADEGRGKIDPAQAGAFRTPTLRGALLRRTFFHDGSVATLDDAVDWHLAGGTGQGADPSIVDLKKVTLTPQERADLGAFVDALSDTLEPTHTPQLP